MKICSPILLTALTLSLAMPATAAPSVNDMQQCQGIIDFVEYKLDNAPEKYPQADIKAVRVGLEGYDNFIQQEIVSPGLLKFNGGDATKAEAMQQQVDAYKLTIVNNFKKRYKDTRFYTDFAVAINECGKKSVPSGQALEDLKVALNTLVKLAKMN
ncbi:hypothetical protein [Neptuniibacter pectenicola]|jgi:uncharacterized protein YfdQ (DUF2303 family)|uniref:hypothetical protein n=1 Tax=Neptuniibacter pectenicola TaxID=1806669 RepID=UPI000794E6E1|nr:MAG: hypothetical protein AXW15_09895 [Neptuniibacter sp. Phe_28]